MDEFERQLRQVLSGDESFDTQRSDALREDVARMYDDKLKTYKWVTWGFLALAMIEMMVLAGAFFVVDNTKLLLAFAVMFLVAYESTVLMKLWYWTMNVKMSTLKEMKELQLQIAELSQKIGSAETGREQGAESPS